MLSPGWVTFSTYPVHTPSPRLEGPGNPTMGGSVVALHKWLDLRDPWVTNPKNTSEVIHPH